MDGDGDRRSEVFMSSCQLLSSNYSFLNSKFPMCLAIPLDDYNIYIYRYL